MAVVRCTACSKMLARHEHAVCPHCGAALPPEPAASVPAAAAGAAAPADAAIASMTPSARERSQKLCPACKAPNPGGARVCRSCGASVAPKRELGDTTTSPIVALLLAALVPGAAYFYVGRGLLAVVFFLVAAASFIVLIFGLAPPEAMQPILGVLVLSRIVEALHSVFLTLVKPPVLEPLPLEPGHAKTALPPPPASQHPGYQPPPRS